MNKEKDNKILKILQYNKNANDKPVNASWITHFLKDIKLFSIKDSL